MLVTTTITKKSLETLVQQTFEHFGSYSCSSLLDSFKLLGFYYATQAGISITIEDLRIPDLKKKLVDNTNADNSLTSEEWQKGLLSDAERFQTILDSWNIIADTLKNKIIEYYEIFDPVNNLYVMAFSGARGNMSQVRQLVGMRGLMSDQAGNIIDLPIQTNFREGLSSIDYMVSSYGARKGIVDTALKTADSGYLTRRLVYVAQELVIRATDCQTKQGLIFSLKKKTNTNLLIGRYLVTNSLFAENKIENSLLSPLSIKKWKQKAPINLIVRSPLTCQSSSSICQKCYGWDLGRQKLIDMGEAVGVVAAQSIGEPGTQLTMRTFHTGGVFTGEIVKPLLSPFSGTVIVPNNFQKVWMRTSHGIPVLKLQQPFLFVIMDWKGIKTAVELEAGSYLYITKSGGIKKNQLLAEFSKSQSLAKDRKIKPVYSPFSGYVRCPELIIRDLKLPEREERYVKVNQYDGILWICASEVFALPQEVKLRFSKKLDINQPFAFLKLITPFSGIVFRKDNEFSLLKQGKKQKLRFLFTELASSVPTQTTFFIKFHPLVANFQYVDKHTILGYVSFYPKETGKIYDIQKQSLKKQNNLAFRTFYVLTDKHIRTVTKDEAKSLKSTAFQKNEKNVSSFFEFIKKGDLYSQNSSYHFSGIFLKKLGATLIFQKAQPIFVTRETLVNIDEGEAIFQNDLLASLVIYTQHTDDIVQGLPKIEQLLEAYSPEEPAFLFDRPGVILKEKLGLPENLTNVKDDEKKPNIFEEVLTTREFAKSKVFINKFVGDKKDEFSLQSEYKSKAEKIAFRDLNKVIYSSTLYEQGKLFDKKKNFRFPEKTEYEAWEKLITRNLYKKKIYQIYVAQSIFLANWKNDTLFYDEQLFQVYRSLVLQGMQKLLRRSEPSKLLLEIVNLKNQINNFERQTISKIIRYEKKHYVKKNLYLNNTDFFRLDRWNLKKWWEKWLITPFSEDLKIQRTIYCSELKDFFPIANEYFPEKIIEKLFYTSGNLWTVNESVDSLLNYFYSNLYCPTDLSEPQLSSYSNSSSFDKHLHNFDLELENSLLQGLLGGEQKLLQTAGYQPGEGEWGVWEDYYYPRLTQKSETFNHLDQFSFFNGVYSGGFCKEQLNIDLPRHNPGNKRTAYINKKRELSRWKKIEVDEPIVSMYTRLGENSFIPVLRVMKTYINRQGDYLIYIHSFLQNKEEEKINKNKIENELDLRFSFLYLKALNPIHMYTFSSKEKFLIEPSTFVDMGEPYTIGMINIHDLMRIFFDYHLILDGLEEGVRKSIIKAQLILLNSIQAIYQSQGVTISSKHVELIVRQLVTYGKVKTIGKTPLLPGEQIRLEVLKQIAKVGKEGWISRNKKQRGLISKQGERSITTFIYEPIFVSATETSVQNESFLSGAGFQETKKVLTKAALFGRVDWLRGLKECVILGRLLPAGSSFLNYNNHLDNFLFLV